MRELELSSHWDVRVAQSLVRRYAAELGFSRRDQAAITLAMSEAGANTIVHGGGRGLLHVRPLYQASLEGQRIHGLRVEARDWGPGIDDLELAVRDHMSRGLDVRTLDRSAHRPSLGTGLGTIARMMDTWGWINLEPGGLLWAEKYLPCQVRQTA